jgi:hypothetical protein
VFDPPYSLTIKPPNPQTFKPPTHCGEASGQTIAIPNKERMKILSFLFLGRFQEYVKFSWTFQKNGGQGDEKVCKARRLDNGGTVN